MVWQTPERLQDHKSAASLSGMMDDLSGMSTPSPASKVWWMIESLSFTHILHTAGRCVERMFFGDRVSDAGVPS